MVQYNKPFFFFYWIVSGEEAEHMGAVDGMQQRSRIELMMAVTMQLCSMTCNLTNFNFVLMMAQD